MKENMNFLFVLVLSFSVNCYTFSVKDIGNKISLLTSELGITGNQNTDESSVISDLCAKKCSKDIEELKKNLTELYAAYLALHTQFAHLNQHLMFHEKALKYIVVKGNKQSAGSAGTAGNQNNDQNLKSAQELNSFTKSSLNDQQNEDSTQDSNFKSHHNHKHHHNSRNHHNHQHRHCHHNRNQFNHNNRDNENENQKRNKDSSEESSEEIQSKPEIVSDFELKTNESIALNDSKSSKKSNSSKQSIEEHFQTIDSEFKEWFDNMLSDPKLIDGIVVNELQNRSKTLKQSIETKIDEKGIDEMENALNSEDLVYATCNVKPNRHIALLNQQDIEGTITLWQLRHNRGPLHMHIKLNGFKVGIHQHNHHNHHNHQNVGKRRVRESNLMPVEQEPDETSDAVRDSHTHGFHLHEFGNLSRDCQSVGSHYNPLNLSHGGPYDVIRHVGDLGNIRCNQNGEIDAEYTYSQVSLSGEHSIINRSLVIHNNPDDYGKVPNSSSSSSSGSSGVRIACCLIEEVKTLPKETDSQSNIGSVAVPVLNSKRRRDTSAQVFHNQNQRLNRFEDSELNEMLKKIGKYENELKY